MLNSVKDILNPQIQNEKQYRILYVEFYVKILFYFV